MKAYKIKRGVGAVFIYLELIIVAIIIIYPLLWVLGSALNDSSGISRSSLIPEKVSLANFKKLFTELSYGRWYLNTLYVAVLTTVFSIVIHTMTAFVFARFDFRGRKMGLLSVMILQMFPSFMSLTALYMIALNFGMLNNLNMLVIVYVAGIRPRRLYGDQ